MQLESDSSLPTVGTNVDLTDQSDRDSDRDRDSELIDIQELFFQDMKIISILAVPIIAKAIGTFLIRKGT